MIISKMMMLKVVSKTLLENSNAIKGKSGFSKNVMRFYVFHCKLKCTCLRISHTKLKSSVKTEHNSVSSSYHRAKKTLNYVQLERICSKKCQLKFVVFSFLLQTFHWNGNWICKRLRWEHSEMTLKISHYHYLYAYILSISLSKRIRVTNAFLLYQ